MNIGINTRFLLPDKLEGFGWFTYEVTKRIVLKHPEVQFYFFFDRKYDPKYIFADNVTAIVLNPPARHPLLFKIWFDYAITRALKKYKIDLFFSPDGYLSLRTSVKQIGVIHDLNFEHFPKDLPQKDSNYLRKNFPLFAKKAHEIITVSEFSKNDICQQYGISEDKITVAYNGVNPKYQPQSDGVKIEIQQKYCAGSEFALFVGSIHPRKNLKRLLLAFEQYKKSSNSNLKLLVVGDRYWWNEELKTCFNDLKYKADIVFTGHLDLSELVKISGTAKFLVYPSYFEGFGLPITEAMQAGTPVLSSDQTSLPEVGGEAVHYIDPFSVDSLSEGIEKLDQNAEFRQELIQKGFLQAKKFNWNTTVEIIWNRISAAVQ